MSYQDAAEELHVTPAAIKQLVVKLEDSVGQKLVVRQGRGIALSEAAKNATDDLSVAMRLMADAVQKMQIADQAERLIVTVEASLATTWLVPRLEDFRVRHPNINVLIDSSQRIVDLTRTDVDVAIRYGGHSAPDLITYRLFDDLVFPACSPTLSEGTPALVSIEQLVDAPLIHWDMSQLPWATETRRWFDWNEWAKRYGLKDIDTSRGLRFSDYGLAVQAAISGQGIILASWPILRDPFDAELLVQPFPDSAQSTSVGYDLVMTKEASIRPEVGAFAEWLKRTASSI